MHMALRRQSTALIGQVQQETELEVRLREYGTYHYSAFSLVVVRSQYDPMAEGFRATCMVDRTPPFWHLAEKAEGASGRPWRSNAACGF